MSKRIITKIKEKSYWTPCQSDFIKGGFMCQPTSRNNA